VQRDSGNTSTGIIYSLQNFESINSIPFAGKTVTFSFYARAGANFSAASSALAYSVNTGTGTDQNLLSGYTGQAAPISTTATLTTTWQRFTATAALSSSATQIGVAFAYTPVGTAGANDYFEVTGVQLEVGSVATPFHTYAATIQGELAACKRYFNRMINASGQLVPGGLYFSATNTAVIGVAYPVEMRTAPTLTATAANFNISGAATATSNGVTTFDNNTQTVTLVFTAAGTPFTFGQSGRVNANTTTSLDWSAEL
jgi:hypothetical protein